MPFFGGILNAAGVAAVLALRGPVLVYKLVAGVKRPRGDGDDDEAGPAASPKGPPLTRWKAPARALDFVPSAAQLSQDVTLEELAGGDTIMCSPNFKGSAWPTLTDARREGASVTYWLDELISILRRFQGTKASKRHTSHVTLGAPPKNTPA